jgi:hypothetical protein
MVASRQWHLCLCLLALTAARCCCSRPGRRTLMLLYALPLIPCVCVLGEGSVWHAGSSIRAVRPTSVCVAATSGRWSWCAAFPLLHFPSTIPYADALCAPTLIPCVCVCR